MELFWHDLIPQLGKPIASSLPIYRALVFRIKVTASTDPIARQAEWIDQWMQQLGIERADIVAHDIGGGVALRLATLFPRRVARLCVMNTVCYDSCRLS